MTEKKLSGDVFYPDEETVSMARVPDWDALGRGRPSVTTRASGRGRRTSCTGSSTGTRCWMIADKPFYKWFIGGKDEHRLQLSGPAHADSPAEQAGADVGRGERGVPVVFLFCPAPGDLPVRQCAPEPGGAKGGPGHAVHGTHPGTDDRHAGLRAHRSDPFRGVSAASRSKRCTNASRTASRRCSSSRTARTSAGRSFR